MTRRCLVFIFLLLAPFFALANDVSATLDRSQIHLGETVTLNVRVQGASSISNPDLSALNQDFDVLGEPSVSSSYSLVNGHASSETILGIALRPKRVGQLQIPSLAIAGAATQPLSLQVLPADSNAATAASGKDVFLEATASPQQVYVGQQFLYTVRLYLDVDLRGGALADPQPQAAEVRRLGADANFDVDRGGKRYHVIERHYALIAQQAGTLTIPSIDFRGEAMSQAAPQDPNDFFAQSGLFGNVVQVSAQSPSVAVTVKTPPADWGKTAWLPARDVSLSLDGLPADSSTLTVGQPVNLHMTIQATGIPAETLPEPSLPTLEGATAYPDKPIDSTKDDGQWLTGRRERNITIIPTRAGSLTIPATTLTWFNVQSERTEVATIAAHTFHVNAAATAAASSPTAPATASSAQAVGEVATGNTTPSSSSASFWRWMALACLALWVLTVIAWFVWWLTRRRKAPDFTPINAAAASSHTRRSAFFTAAKGTDRKAQAGTLLDWARSERPELQNLGQLSSALMSTTQRSAIDRLQRLHYATATDNEPLDLHGAFAKGFQWRSDDLPDDDSPLPPLYPFKLR